MNEPTKLGRFRVIVLFALVGAALGVVLAMLLLSTGDNGYGRTPITESAALTAITVGIGFVVGHALSERPESVEREIAFGVLLLTALLGATLGWLTGDAWARDSDVLIGRRVPPLLAVVVGGVVGLVPGVLVLAPRWLRLQRGKRRSTATETR